jgi:hypothetical protein
VPTPPLASHRPMIKVITAAKWRPGFRNDIRYLQKRRLTDPTLRQMDLQRGCRNGSAAAPGEDDPRGGELLATLERFFYTRPTRLARVG